MTEAEWLEGTDPHEMLPFLRGKASERKLRLFAVACCRLVWERIPPTAREAAELAERYADGNGVGSDMLSLQQQLLQEEAQIPEELGNGWGTAYHSLRFPAMEAADAAFRTAAISRWVYLPDDAPPESQAEQRVINHKMRADERFLQAEILLDIFSNPCRPAVVDASWLAPVVVAFAHSIYNTNTFHHLPILADALEEAGCTDAAILGHCRGAGPHVRGCWVVDLLLGKT
jgi:hypothetical protein